MAINAGGVQGLPPLNSTSVVSSYSPVCSFSGIRKGYMSVSLGGFKSNEPISSSSPAVFSLGQRNFRIGDQLVSCLQTKYPSTNQTSVKLTAFNVSISNATPSIRNLLPSGGYPASAVIGAGEYATFPSAEPSKTYPNVTFTPIASSIGKNQQALLSYDNVAGTLNLFDPNSKSLASVPFSCSEGVGKEVLPH
ncbi:unnamed protein product [Tilletia controversa]|nr:unnamed protein product [Tilletia controversa]CAD6919987.1 unnamed protein product [Tilletia controversa]CAD6979002.1 unnamed protein product [Tilletia controversa]